MDSSNNDNNNSSHLNNSSNNNISTTNNNNINNTTTTDNSNPVNPNTSNNNAVANMNPQSIIYNLNNILNNDPLDPTQSLLRPPTGARELIEILDRLKQQAEELLRSAQEMGNIHGLSTDLSSETRPSIPEISPNLRLIYSVEVPIEKQEFIKQVVFLSENTLFLLYADMTFTTYDITHQRILLSGSIAFKNIMNIERFKLFESLSTHMINNNNNDNPHIIFFEPNEKSLIIFSLKTQREISRFEFKDRFLEESLQYRQLENEIIILFKRGQVGDDQEQEDEQSSYYTVRKFTILPLSEPQQPAIPSQIIEVEQEGEVPVEPSKLIWKEIDASTFAINRILCNKSMILSKGQIILYNSFTRTNERFSYCEFVGKSVIVRQRMPLAGQLVALVEFSETNRIGFLLNLHSSSQFKFIVHDLDQLENSKQVTFEFQSISKQLLVTQLFCFFDDRYLGLQVQDASLGCRNLIFDILSQTVIAVLPGDYVPAVFLNDKTQIRIASYENDTPIEENTLKVFYFSKPRAPIMKILQNQSIERLYGELACKDIIDILYPNPTQPNTLEEK